jgi:hypothetical protein
LLKLGQSEYITEISKVRDKLGLKNVDWKQLSDEVQRLNANAPPGTLYKLLYIGRHGEGWHNLAERKYGRQAWDVSAENAQAREKFF